jgi:hypothetical protein
LMGSGVSTALTPIDFIIDVKRSWRWRYNWLTSTFSTVSVCH